MLTRATRGRRPRIRARIRSKSLPNAPGNGMSMAVSGFFGLPIWRFFSAFGAIFQLEVHIKPFQLNLIFELIYINLSKKELVTLSRC